MRRAAPGTPTTHRIVSHQTSHPPITTVHAACAPPLHPATARLGAAPAPHLGHRACPALRRQLAADVGRHLSKVCTVKWRHLSKVWSVKFLLCHAQHERSLPAHGPASTLGPCHPCSWHPGPNVLPPKQSNGPHLFPGRPSHPGPAPAGPAQRGHPGGKGSAARGGGPAQRARGARRLPPCLHSANTTSLTATRKTASSACITQCPGTWHSSHEQAAPTTTGAGGAGQADRRSSRAEAPT